MSLRYLQAANKNSTISSMMYICFFGIFIATFSIALIVSITQGFQQATYEKMQSIYPQIIIDAHGQELNYEELTPILQDPAYKIAHVAPQQTAQALCNAIGSQDIPYVIQLKGIDPLYEKNVTPLEKMILPKQQTHYLEKLVQANQVIIGKQLAQQLQLSTGSQLNIIFTSQEDMSKKLDFDQTKVIVAGIFDTGIDDFDANFIYCSSTFFTHIFPDRGITQIYAKLDDQQSELESIQNLEKVLGLNVYSWKKLYSSLVAALELEKYAMIFILLLIILVASSNIISLLFMQITQKRKDIAILLTLGLSPYKVKSIFLGLSMTISIIATATGLVTAWCVGIFLQNYHWIKLPDNIYYTAHLPVLLDGRLFLFIFFAVLTISFLASLIPLQKIKMKNIATILRNEI